MQPTQIRNISSKDYKAYKNLPYKKYIQDYLLGEHKNLFGTILGFKKGWRKNRHNMIEYYSFLLYYSHKTGRIERFQFNGKDINENIYSNLSIIENTEDKESVAIVDNKRGQILHKGAVSHVYNNVFPNELLIKILEKNISRRC